MKVMESGLVWFLVSVFSNTCSPDKFKKTVKNLMNVIKITTIALKVNQVSPDQEKSTPDYQEEFDEEDEDIEILVNSKLEYFMYIFIRNKSILSLFLTGTNLKMKRK